MVADITDKSTQIEELEAQLGAQLHKMQIVSLPVACRPNDCVL